MKSDKLSTHRDLSCVVIPCDGKIQVCARIDVKQDHSILPGKSES